jgi:hypothetical protein
MKKLSLIATALVASTLATAASANTLTSTTTNLTSVNTTSLTSWSGLSGVKYTAYAPLSAEQQAVELKGAVDAKLANQTLPNTISTLPAYTPYAAPTKYGYGTTDVLTTVRQSEACSTSATTPVGAYSKTWSKSAVYGNSLLGGGYTSYFTLAATAGTGTSDKISGDAYAKVNGAAFGNTGSIEGKAFAQLQGTAVTHNIFLKRNGVTVWTPGTTTGVLSFTKAYTGSVASGSTTIWLGPVPVSFSGTANASYGINGSLSYASATLTASVTPYANITTTAAASISIGVASAGVSGTAKVNASLPLVAKLGVNTANQFKYDLDFDATLSAQGNVNGWAKVYYFFGSKQWNTNLVSYSYTGTLPIVDVHGCSGAFTF